MSIIDTPTDMSLESEFDAYAPKVVNTTIAPPDIVPAPSPPSRAKTEPKPPPKISSSPSPAPPSKTGPAPPPPKPEPSPAPLPKTGPAPLQPKAAPKEKPEAEAAPQPKAEAKSKPKSKPDNLALIKGMSPEVLSLLNEKGINSFIQIASLSNEESLNLEEELSIPGRIQRWAWVLQAKLLLEDS